MKNLSDNLLSRLIQAEIVCRSCGEAYGKYSVGCSSVWQADCDVCGETKGCTEVRDYGYLSKGIKELQGTIKEQSKVVASYMASVGPIMTDAELEDALTPSYEQGEITLKLTEEEVGFLNECLDVIQEHHLGLDENDPVDVALFESVEKKITELYADYCIKYELAPAMKAYYAKFASYGNDDEEDRVRWATFRDAFNAGLEYSKEAQ